MFKILIIIGVLVWIGATIYIAWKKDKMLALVVFYSIPVVVMFILVLIMIIMVSLKKTIQ